MEKFISSVPGLSLIAFVMMAFFNIGYFTVVGLHFLGLIDLTNVVYSFALALGLMWALSGFFSTNWVTDSKKIAAIPQLANQMKWAYIAAQLLGTALVIAAYFDAAKLYPSQLSSEGVGLAGAVLALLGATLWAILKYYEKGKVEEADILFPFFLMILTALLAGRLVANREMHNSVTYTVITKERTAYPGVRLLRTSSAGLLFFHEGAVQFIPQSEITLIRSATTK